MMNDIKISALKNDAMSNDAMTNDLIEAYGYFGPASITWQIYREPIFVLGGVRALLLQVAHPAVADGVARYSNFKSDPFGRGYRTFAAMAMIYFGSRKQAEQTAKRLFHIHSAIRGEAPNPYSANQPELLLWVLATLTDTTLRVYEQMPAQGLPNNWKEIFYEESKIAARLLGIPDEVYPADLQAFNAYFSAMLEGDLLGSTETCRVVAQTIVKHPRAPKNLANLLATGWLPATLCKRLGIEVRKDAANKLARWAGRVIRIYSFLPKRLRWNPSYHQAQYRVALARGERPEFAGRFCHWLVKRVKVPLSLES